MVLPGGIIRSSVTERNGGSITAARHTRAPAPVCQQDEAKSVLHTLRPFVRRLAVGNYCRRLLERDGSGPVVRRSSSGYLRSAIGKRPRACFAARSAMMPIASLG